MLFLHIYVHNSGYNLSPFHLRNADDAESAKFKWVYPSADTCKQRSEGRAAYWNNIQSLAPIEIKFVKLCYSPKVNEHV